MAVTFMVKATQHPVWHCKVDLVHRWNMMQEIQVSLIPILTHSRPKPVPFYASGGSRGKIARSRCFVKHKEMRVPIDQAKRWRF